MPVKGFDIATFCRSAMQYPDTWSYEGFLFFMQEENSNDVIPMVADHKTYELLTANIPDLEENSVKLLILEKDLKTAIPNIEIVKPVNKPEKLLERKTSS
jgi:hypothetical protein